MVPSSGNKAEIQIKADLYFFAELHSQLGANQAMWWMKSQAAGHSSSIASTPSQASSENSPRAATAHARATTDAAPAPPQQTVGRSRIFSRDLEVDEIRVQNPENLGLLYTDAAHLVRKPS